MEKSNGDHHAAFSGSDKETQAASVRKLDDDRPETKIFETSAKEAGSAPLPPSAPAESESEHTSLPETLRTSTKLFGYVRGIITWMPKNCRYDPDKPPKFNLALNLLFAFVSLQYGPPECHLHA